ncbi:MAG: hypothetical protein LQ337_004733 [Flavoplaca oasis]|nr:MAG: hypothetical protein LQ337_004733 [Flavoplaca oasis]
MIGESRAAYVFIRAFVLLLRSITPLSILYCSLRPILPISLRPSISIELAALAESLFYFLVFLPRKYRLQSPVDHPAPLSRSARKRLFRQCLDTVPNGRRFLQLGTVGYDRHIRRENVKEWLCWAFMNRNTWSEGEDQELEEYVQATEILAEQRISPGRGHFQSLRITQDEFTVLHRPLVWYLLMVGGHDIIAHTYLSLHSFHLHRRPLHHFFKEFPPRPLSLFCRHITRARKLTYYHHPHNSTTHLPVVLIHGVGIGLHTYMRLMSEFVAASDGTIGFIALEIMPISFRLTHAPMRKDELCAEILTILNHHGYDRFIVIGQSFGTLMAAQMLHHPVIGPRVDSLILFDPVTFLLHLTEMAYNFTRRPPRTANQHQLYYFASTDIGIAHTLARCIFWAESILWKEDLGNRRCTVVLRAKDIVVAAEEVGRYLTRAKGMRAVDDRRGANEDAWKRRAWTGKGIDVLWFEDNDHGEIIDTKKGRKVLIHAALVSDSTR